MAGAACSGLGSGGSSSLSSGKALGVLDVAGRLPYPALRPVERLAQPVVEALPVEDDLPASVHCPEGQDHGSPPPSASLN